jgi:hypothetical protein
VLLMTDHAAASYKRLPRMSYGQRKAILLALEQVSKLTRYFVLLLLTYIKDSVSTCN